MVLIVSRRPPQERGIASRRPEKAAKSAVGRIGQDQKVRRLGVCRPVWGISFFLCSADGQAALRNLVTLQHTLVA